MRVPVTKELSEIVAAKAQRNAREYARGKKWRSGQSIQPVAQTGKAGLRVTRKYLMFVERGTRPFLMTALEGKTVPIDGRFVKVRGVGQPGYVTLPGGVKVFRQQKWKHPGIVAQNFMRDSIEKGIKDSEKEIQNVMKKVLSGRA